MPVILSCSLSLYRADVFSAMPSKPVAKKPIPVKARAVKLQTVKPPRRMFSRKSLPPTNSTIFAF
jgi:hypothetical protein